ncbi:eukaryotic translation initiation factor 3 subunit E-interacting protein [Thraustotheca clavata]|uniref:Eukaryotic translation initiation factor 3 subunit L n=1 Tax=Thraustotheca clavata TaxID=74557 RepID=A0A1V9Z752_9STRA|nr:eukaryotic translation initiation factor 3 subunit E-interacting protein [Thraustotheca clavata]
MSDYSDKPADFLFPESVKQWFLQMTTALMGGNSDEMLRLYDKEFATLTSSYFKQSPWPDPDSDAVLSLSDEDPVFLTLYTQIYYRHMFSKLSPTNEFKKASWDNYCAIFEGILDKSLELDVMPSQWLFDIVGEFVYQYQSFCQYRAKGSKTDESMWNTKDVLSYLHRIIKYSNIKAVLAAQDANQPQPEVPSESVKELGYFALICLSRAHVLFGDFFTALCILKPIDFKKRDQLYQKSYSCHVSVYYHMGFAQLMLGDVANAVRSFAKIILQVHRNRAYYSKFADYDQVNKLTEKALSLLMLALYLCPGYTVEEQINALLREKLADKQSAVQKGDISVLSDIFVMAAPKFILPNVQAESEDVSKKATALQLKLFLELVQRHSALPSLHSYVKLYRSIDVEKLARFRGVSVAACLSEIMAFKLKAEALQSDVHFFVSDSIVKVDEQKREQRTGQYYMTQISKLQRVVNSCATSD